jgi:hypothetical protein
MCTTRLGKSLVHTNLKIANSLLDVIETNLKIANSLLDVIEKRDVRVPSAQLPG